MTTKRQRRLDPFQLLAIASVLLGMLIVVGAALFWAITGRQSSLIVGTGLLLTTGGPLIGRFELGIRKLGDLLVYAEDKDGKE